MSSDLYTNLEWLLPPPADFRQRCRAIASDAVPGRAIARLAAYSLDENQLRHLASAIDTARAAGKPFTPLTPVTLGLLGNATLEPLVPALIATAARHGIDLQCIEAGYAQTLQEALLPDSIINRANPDAVLLALDHRGLPLRGAIHDPQIAAACVADSIAFLDSLRRGFQSHSNALSIVQTLPALPETTFGSFDRSVPGTLRRLCADFNAAVVENVKDTHDLILDVAALAETVGLADWHAPGQWNIGKFAFDTKFLPLYAEHVARLLGALKGKSRKCLVLDLDNTVWGGVIGDDGLEGIIIGQGDATGEAYLDVQRAALDLRDRGIVLAISSKNADDVARSAFRGHPEMLLRENHIAVFQANWNDKATNISAIASELSIGLDSIVFVDDNPAERALVREMLPEVAVPELPEDPALYARTLAAAGYFETVAFSQEDRNRAGFYADNARRVALQSQAGDLESYLASLHMKVVFRPFDATGRSRIAQLINKSNQFNLTTHRYSELAVAELERDPACFTLQVRLLDTFGDNGMISVVVCRPRPNSVWEIDTWLMSCRVLGRRVEQMVLREILSHARARGIKKLLGVYVPSGKNGLVRDHYAKLGFELIEQGEGGRTTWELDTATKVEAAPMTEDSGGFQLAPA
jgi:FkbH-like protein